MSNEERPWELGPPMRIRHGEIFNHENVEFYNVERAIREITAAPTRFQFVVLPIEMFASQVTKRGNLDLPYVASLSNDDAIRPVLLGSYPNGTVRLLDGYHRIMRLMQFRIGAVATWRLSSEQTSAIMLPSQYMTGVDRV